MLHQNTRTFGLEFEHVNKLTINQLASAMITAKVAVDPNGINHTNYDYRGWQVKPDGSIHGQNDYCYGIEIASPPMTFRDYPAIKTALKVAKLTGGVNTSCGLHVHVFAPELRGVLALRPNDAWREYVTNVWQNIEPVLFSYVPPSRRSSSYARPGIVWGRKYSAFNTAPLTERNTVEFRLHHSTLNPMKAIAWAALCHSIVEFMVKRMADPGKLNPITRFEGTPKLVRTRSGTEFYLQQEKSSRWLLEASKLKLKSEFNSLAEGYNDLNKFLKLDSTRYLPAFHYPTHCNAMARLCDLVGLNGVFKSYLADRYERNLKKHGVANVNGERESSLLPDNEEFYNEPLLQQSQPQAEFFPDAPTIIERAIQRNRASNQRNPNT